MLRKKKELGYKVLILTVLAGMGHIRAAQAIEEALKESGEVETRCFDPMDLLSPRFAQFINRFYLWMIEPPFHHLWGFFYENKFLAAPYSPLRWFITHRYAQGIQEILKGFTPEVIVSTHPFTTAGAALLKKRGVIKVPLVSCATDFDVHPFGICKEVDLFAVPDVVVSTSLEKEGISRERIGIYGIPIDPKFTRRLSKRELRNRLGLREDLPVILILSGGFGVGPIEEIVTSFKDFKDVQLMVVAGMDRLLKERLEEIKDGLDLRIKVFGYIENMEELMEASDLVVTKPGGLSIAEALAKRLPLIFLPPIKGQEVKNFKHLTRTGVGIYSKKISQIPRIITYLLNHPAKLNLMKSKLDKLSRPNSSVEIAKFLLDLARQKRLESNQEAIYKGGSR